MMHPIRSFLMVLLLPCSAMADDPRLGQKVFWKVGAQATQDGKPVAIETVPFPAVASKAEGDRLWLETAWVGGKDILLADEALAYYTEQIRGDAGNAAIWRRRALIWSAKEEFDRAVADSLEAVRLDPTSAAGYAIRGSAWYALGEYDNALADYGEALRIAPDEPEARAKRALAQEAKANADRISEALAAGLRIGPMSPRGYVEIGNMWWSQGETEKAIECYDEAIRLRPDFGPAYRCRGAAWNAKGEYDKAIPDFEHAIRSDPMCEYAHYGLGIALEWKGDHYPAIEHLSRAIELDPSDVDARGAAAWILATCADGRCRNGRLAVEHATKACELTKWTFGDYIDTLAAAWAEAGDFAWAIRCQEKAIGMALSDKEKEAYDRHLAAYAVGQPFRDEPQK
jgi:tetratricopeptide (TPR) repeat protein